MSFEITYYRFCAVISTNLKLGTLTPSFIQFIVHFMNLIRCVNVMIDSRSHLQAVGVKIRTVWP